VHPLLQRPEESGRPAATGYIRERSVSVVAIEDVLAPVGDEQVVEAVIVIVAHTYAAKPSPSSASLPASVTSVKLPSRLFFKEPVAGARGSVG